MSVPKPEPSKRDGGCLWVDEARREGSHHPERVKCEPGSATACVNCGGTTAPIKIPVLGSINEPKLEADGWRVVRNRDGRALRMERIA